MCWRCTLTLSLSLVFPSPVSPIYSSLHVSQMMTYMRLKLSHVKWFFNLKVIWTFLKVYWSFIKRKLQHSHLLSIQLNVPDKTSPYSALVKSFLRLGGWRLLCIIVDIMKAANAIIFQTNNRGFNSAINIRVILIKCCNEWQDIFIWRFFRFS